MASWRNWEFINGNGLLTVSLSIKDLLTVNMPWAVSPIGGPDKRFKNVVICKSISRPFTVGFLTFGGLLGASRSIIRGSPE